MHGGGWGVGLLPTVRPHLACERADRAAGSFADGSGGKKKKSFLISGFEGRQPASGTLCGI